MNMVTISGRSFDLKAPVPADIDIKDIGHALSNICRFAGHVKEFYSVAEHSVAVAAWLRKQGFAPGVQMAGLLHDAHEAYTGDLPTPLKRLMGFSVDAVQGGIQALIHTMVFGKPNLKAEAIQAVTEADRVLLHVEAIQLQDATWASPEIAAQYDITLACLEPTLARGVFMVAFAALTEEMK